MQTSPGGHADVTSDRYSPSTWKEFANSSKDPSRAASKWHGKVGVVAETQAFLKQLQSRQQASWWLNSAACTAEAS